MLLQAEHRGRDDLHQGMSTARLAEQFRDDVHAAAAGLPQKHADKHGWQFQLPPDRIVVYEVKPGMVTRTERVGGAAAAGILRAAGPEHGRHRGLAGLAAGGGLFAAGTARRKAASRGGGLRPRLPLCQDARREGTMMSDRNCRRRRGTILVMVIVCLVVATVVCGLLLKIAVLARESADAQHHRVQARWLAESGIERAAARLAVRMPATAAKRGRCPPPSCPTAGRCGCGREPRAAGPTPAWSASRPVIPTILCADADIRKKLW